MIYTTTPEKIKELNLDDPQAIYIVEIDDDKRTDAKSYIFKNKLGSSYGGHRLTKFGIDQGNWSYIRVTSEETAVLINALFGRHAV
jgi:hypothetical protein